MSKTVQEILNDVMRDTGLGQALGYATSQPRYRFYRNSKKSEDMFFWTVEKINHNGKPRYVSGVYKYKKGKKEWIPIRQVGHSKKKAAIARAYKLYQQAQ